MATRAWMGRRMSERAPFLALGRAGWVQGLDGWALDQAA